MDNRNYDVIIVGAGMVGAVLANALGERGVNVAVLEPAPPAMQWADDSIDLRVSAISRASQQIFRTLGAWEGMSALRVSPFYEMHVWDSVGNGEIHFDSADIGADAMGFIVENRVIRRVLLEKLALFDNVDLLCPAKLRSFTSDPQQVSVTLEDGAVLVAKLLVGADGAGSRVRQGAQILVRGWDYGQKGLVSTVRTEKSHEFTAWQRFLPDGPLAFLPLNDGRSSIVWTTTPERAEWLTTLDEAAFRKELGDAFAYKLGKIESIGRRATFPLRLQHATEYVKPRVALIGDAAHTIHPLAGQGANLGFLDAAALAETLLPAYEAGHDLGALKTLRRYERWRKADNLAMMSAMDGFKRAFGTEKPLVRLARNFGLNATDRLAPLKLLFMRHAMGLTSDLPKMARVAP